MPDVFWSLLDMFLVFLAGYLARRNIITARERDAFVEATERLRLRECQEDSTVTQEVMEAARKRKVEKQAQAQVLRMRAKMGTGVVLACCLSLAACVPQSAIELVRNNAKTNERIMATQSEGVSRFARQLAQANAYAFYELAYQLAGDPLPTWVTEMRRQRKAPEGQTDN